MWILMLWTMVAAAGQGNPGERNYYDWRPIGGFSTETECKAAVQSLNVASRSRCLKGK